MIQARADKKFALLKVNPAHPSLHFKQIGPYYSARVSDNYRALALKDGNDFVWFWIGPHDSYERLIKRL